MAVDFLAECKPYLDAHRPPKGPGILRRRAIVLSFLDSDYKFQRGQTAECVTEIRRRMGVEVSGSLVGMDAAYYRRAIEFLNIEDRAERAAFLEHVRSSGNPEYRIVNILAKAGIQDWAALDARKAETPTLKGATSRRRTKTTTLPVKPEELAEEPPEQTTEPMVRISKRQLDDLHGRVDRFIALYREQASKLEATLRELEDLKAKHRELQDRLQRAEKDEARIAGRAFETFAQEYAAFKELDTLLNPNPDEHTASASDSELRIK